jgi:hypothetical protein
LAASKLDTHFAHHVGLEARKTTRQLRPIQLVAVIFVSLFVFVNAVRAASDFQFEDVASLEDMQRAALTKLSIGSPSEELRKIFVTAGHPSVKGATLRRACRILRCILVY